MEERINGTVKWFSNDRGYGFVLIDGNPDAEYFIHFTSIDMDGYKTVKAGQPVSFILKNTEKGIQATEVKLLQ